MEHIVLTHKCALSLQQDCINLTTKSGLFYLMIIYHAKYPICEVLLLQKQRMVNDSFGLRHDQFLTPGNKMLVSTRMQLKPSYQHKYNATLHPALNALVPSTLLPPAQALISQPPSTQHPRRRNTRLHANPPTSSRSTYQPQPSPDQTPLASGPSASASPVCSPRLFSGSHVLFPRTTETPAAHPAS